jgi:hypothetical protein
MSTLSRRSATPTISASYSQRLSNTATGSNDTPSLNPPIAIYQRDRDVGAYELESPSDQPFTAGTLDALDNKHVSLMGDIEDIEQRLDYLLAEVGG